MTVDEAQPKLLANKVILQMVRHVVSEDLPVAHRDYSAIRVVFRQCGGSWEKLVGGDQVHTELLKTVITAWGALPLVQMAGKQVV